MRARTWTIAAAVVIATLTPGSAASAAWTVRTPLDVAGDGDSLATPAAPRATINAGNVVVNWTAPSGSAPATGWQVLRGAAVVCTTAAATTSCTDTAPPAGTPLTYRVRGTLDNWASPASPASDPVTVPATASLKVSKPAADNPARAADPPAPQPKPAAPTTEKTESTTPAPAPAEKVEPSVSPTAGDITPAPVNPPADSSAP
jgi:hypothetical protein